MRKTLLPHSLEPILIPKITEAHIETYGAVANDFNAIHFDTQVAQNAGFTGRIAHGMLPMGISTKLISPWLTGNLLITTYDTRFTNPLILGDSLQIIGECIENTSTTAQITFSGVNQNGNTIITGKIHVKERS